MIGNIFAWVKYLKPKLVIYLLFASQVARSLANNSDSAAEALSNPSSYNFRDNNDLTIFSHFFEVNVDEMLTVLNPELRETVAFLIKEESEDLLQQIKSFVQVGNSEGAKNAVLEFAKVKPDSLFLAMWKTQITEEMKSAADRSDYVTAESMIDILLEFDPHDPEIIQAKINFLLLQKKDLQALVWTQELVSLNSDHQDNAHSFDLVDAALSAKIEREPGALISLHALYENDYSTVMKKILEVNPSSILVHDWKQWLTEKCNYAIKNGHYTLAKIYIEQLVESDSKDELPLGMKAELYYRQNKLEEAGNLLKKLSKKPNFILTIEQELNLAFQKKDIAQAVTLADHLHKMIPSDDNHIRVRFQTNWNAKKAEDLQFAKEHLKINPESEYALAYIVNFYYGKNSLASYKSYGMKLEEIEVQTIEGKNAQLSFKDELAHSSQNYPLLRDVISQSQKTGQHYLGDSIQAKKTIATLEKNYDEYKKLRGLPSFSSLSQMYTVPLNIASRKAFYKDKTDNLKTPDILGLVKKGFGIILKNDARLTPYGIKLPVFDTYQPQLLIFKDDIFHLYLASEKDFEMYLNKDPSISYSLQDLTKTIRFSYSSKHEPRNILLKDALEQSIAAVITPNGSVFSSADIESYDQLLSEENATILTSTMSLIVDHISARPIQSFFMALFLLSIIVDMIRRLVATLFSKTESVRDIKLDAEVKEVKPDLSELLAKLNAEFSSFIREPWYQVDENTFALNLASLRTEINVQEKNLLWAKDCITLRPKNLQDVWLKKLQGIFGKLQITEDQHNFIIKIDFTKDVQITAEGLIDKLIINSVEYQTFNLNCKIAEMNKLKGEEIKTFLKFISNTFAEDLQKLTEFRSDAELKMKQYNNETVIKFAKKIISIVDNIKMRVSKESLDKIANKNEDLPIKTQNEEHLQNILSQLELNLLNLREEIDAIKVQVDNLGAVVTKLNKSVKGATASSNLPSTYTKAQKKDTVKNESHKQPNTPVNKSMPRLEPVIAAEKVTDSNGRSVSKIKEGKQEEEIKVAISPLPASESSSPTFFQEVGIFYRKPKDEPTEPPVSVTRERKPHQNLLGFSEEERSYISSISHYVKLINVQGIRDLEPPTLRRSALAGCLIGLCESLKRYDCFLRSKSQTNNDNAANSYIENIEYVINLRNWLRHLFETVNYKHSEGFLEYTFDKGLKTSLLSLKGNHENIKKIGLLKLTTSSLYRSLQNQYQLCLNPACSSIQLSKLEIDYSIFKNKLTECLDRLMSGIKVLKNRSDLGLYIYHTIACKKEIDLLGKLYTSLNQKELITDKGLKKLLVECQKIRGELGHALDEEDCYALVEAVDGDRIYNILLLVKDYCEQEMKGMIKPDVMFKKL